MRKRTAAIGLFMSLMPLGQPLVIKTGVALTTTGVILAIPEDSKAENADNYYNRGNQKYRSGDYFGAISDFNKVIRINPKDSDAYHKRGDAKSKLEDHSGAISDYSKAVEISPSAAT